MLEVKDMSFIVPAQQSVTVQFIMEIAVDVVSNLLVPQAYKARFWAGRVSFVQSCSAGLDLRYVFLNSQTGVRQLLREQKNRSNYPAFSVTEELRSNMKNWT